MNNVNIGSEFKLIDFICLWSSESRVLDLHFGQSLMRTASQTLHDENVLILCETPTAKPAAPVCETLKKMATHSWDGFLFHPKLEHIVQSITNLQLPGFIMKSLMV